MRETLTVRNKGIEALIASLPVEPAERDQARQFAIGLTNSLSKWDMERRQRGTNGVRHG